MMGNNYFLLQTENTDPLVLTVEKLTQKIDENDKLITNLLETTDGLKFPRFQIENEADNQWHHRDDESELDELRYHLDTKYGLQQMESPDFDTQNPRIAQLLSDNYKLVRLYNMKQRYNQELLKVLRKYQQVLMIELLPSLGRFNQTQTAETFKQLRQIANNKLDHDQLVYDQYVYYTHYLQRFHDIIHQLLGILNSVDSKFSDIETKLLALNNLLDQVSVNSPVP